MILDDLVLDCSKFVKLHPGGQFVLTHNAGRDISKFFYGGYSMEGNIGNSKPAFGYNHSSYAKRIIESLAIATYESSVIAVETNVRILQDETKRINGTT